MIKYTKVQRLWAERVYIIAVMVVKRLQSPVAPRPDAQHVCYCAVNFTGQACPTYNIRIDMETSETRSLV